MSDKTFKIVNGDISDGYHTFDELYEHRCFLFLAWILSDGCPGAAYYIPDHYEGWDLVGVEITNIGQISYHIPSKHRHLYELSLRADPQHIWDGHTSNDVLVRICEWLTRK